MTLCAICTVHVEMRSASFLVEPQNQGRRFVSSLTLKSLGRFSPVWPQNRCGLTSKSIAMIFFGLALKSVATVSLGSTSKPVAQVSYFWP
jgi:hypothetical protein